MNKQTQERITNRLGELGLDKSLLDWGNGYSDYRGYTYQCLAWFCSEACKLGYDLQGERVMDNHDMRIFSRSEQKSWVADSGRNQPNIILKRSGFNTIAVWVNHYYVCDSHYGETYCCPSRILAFSNKHGLVICSHQDIESKKMRYRFKGYKFCEWLKKLFICWQGQLPGRDYNFIMNNGFDEPFCLPESGEFMRPYIAAMQ
jgi:hypothetical protein